MSHSCDKKLLKRNLFPNGKNHLGMLTCEFGTCCKNVELPTVRQTSGDKHNQQE